MAAPGGGGGLYYNPEPYERVSCNGWIRTNLNGMVFLGADVKLHLDPWIRIGFVVVD
jgi:hypothetical protein